MPWRQVAGATSAPSSAARSSARSPCSLVAMGFADFEAFDTALGANRCGDDGTGYALWAALLLELVLTVVFVYVILAVTDERNEHPAARAAGHRPDPGRDPLRRDPRDRHLGQPRPLDRACALRRHRPARSRSGLFILAPLLGRRVAGLIYPIALRHGARTRCPAPASRVAAPGGGARVRRSGPVPAAVEPAGLRRPRWPRRTAVGADHPGRLAVGPGRPAVEPGRPGTARAPWRRRRSSTQVRPRPAPTPAGPAQLVECRGRSTRGSSPTRGPVGADLSGPGRLLLPLRLHAQRPGHGLVVVAHPGRLARRVDRGCSHPRRDRARVVEGGVRPVATSAIAQARSSRCTEAKDWSGSARRVSSSSRIVAGRRGSSAELSPGPRIADGRTSPGSALTRPARRRRRAW